MSISTDWDVDYYKTDYESEEHWSLRRSFMEKHKDKFSEDELVCLAQVFTNVEFLGCKYPEETMRKVALLSQEVAADFRKVRATKLKRTFVGAADAAGAKVKAQEQNQSNANEKESIKKRHREENEGDLNNKKHRPEPESSQSFQNNSRNKKANIFPNNTRDRTKCFENIYNNFILFEPINNNTLQEQQNFQNLLNSASKQKIKMDVIYKSQGDQIKCTIYINGTLVAQNIAENKKESRTEACALAIDKVKQICYTIKAKAKSLPSINIDTSGRDMVHEELVKNTEKKFEENKLNENNKGFKMMKLLGWSGGALSAGGIEEPVSVQLKVDRKGLGGESSNHKINYKYFFDYLSNYHKDTSNIYELVFSKEFTREERTTLHSISGKIGLKSISRNTPDGDRYLTISKKISLSMLANNILNNGLYSEIYDLIEPSQKIVN